MILETLALLAAGVLDRVRGGAVRNKYVQYLASSLACALIAVTVTPGWAMAAFGLVWGFVAWRHDNGWRGHWLRRDAGKRWWQPWRWGALWASPVALVGYWVPDMLVLLATGPLGAFLAISIGVWMSNSEFYTPWSEDILGLNHGWAWSEVIELPIIGALTLFVLGL